MTQYLVGFDRFVALEWANFAMELAANSDSKSVKISCLKDWLSLSISGKDSGWNQTQILSILEVKRRDWRLTAEKATTFFFIGEWHYWSFPFSGNLVFK